MITNTIVTAQNIFPLVGNVGIGSNLPPIIIPIKPLHILNHPNWTNDPAIRLESGNIIGGQVAVANNGHLALLTATNLAFYTRCLQYPGLTTSSASVGDMVLQTSDRGNDLILTTRNAEGHIRFATTPTDIDGPGGILDDDYERMTITPSGKIGIQCTNPLGALDVNLGTANWTYNLPKISLIQGNNGFPQIRLYTATGNSWNDRAESTSWYIEQSNTYDYQPLIPGTYGALRFRAGINSAGGGAPYLNDIGSESPITRMSLISNGNVGINQEIPTAKFQVSNGSILYDGSVGSTPKNVDNSELGAGTRLMWIPEKAAFRAGKLELISGSPSSYNADDPDFGIYFYKENSWDDNLIGENSFVFGYNSRAVSEGDIAMGINNVSNSTSSLPFEEQFYGTHGAITIGHSNLSTGCDGVAMGYANKALAIGATSIGFNCKATAPMSKALGFYVESSGNYAVGIGNIVKATGNLSMAIGNECNATASGSFVIGSGYSEPHRLINNQSNSLYVGFHSNIPIFFIGGGGYNSLGKIGVGTTAPGCLLGVNGTACIGWSGTGVVPSPPSTGNPGDDANPVSLIVEKTVIIHGNTNSGATLAPAYVYKPVSGTDNYGVSNGASYLQVWGEAIKFTTTSTWDVPSDARYKKEVHPFEDGLQLLKQVQPVRFKFNEKLGVEGTEEGIGVIAQDIQKIFPYTVHEQEFVTSVRTKEEKRYEVDDIDTVIVQVIDISKADTSNFDQHSHHGHPSNYKDSTIYKPIKRWVIEPAEFENVTAPLLTYNSSAVTYVLINSVKELDSLRVLDKQELIKKIVAQNIRIDSQNIKIDVQNLRIESQNLRIESQNFRIDSLILANKNLEERIGRLETKNQIPLNEATDVVLEQNNPNPFSESSTITYYIPEKILGEIELVITSATDQTTVLKRIPCSKGMPFQSIISARDMNTGVYVYSLIGSGKVLATKKLIIIK